MTAIANFVHELSTSVGTGAFALSTVNGRQSFNDAFGYGATEDVFHYFISNRDAAEWERGTGHLSGAGTLVRDTPLEGSSGDDTLVSFGLGTKDVTNSMPAGLLSSLLQSRYISVLDYGVFGETGVTGFDSTAAVQAAFDAVGDLNNIVYFPPGQYWLYSPITINKACIVQGPGRGVGDGSSATIEIVDAEDTGFNAFEVVTANAVVFRDLGFRDLLARTTGSCIYVASDGVDINLYSRFENLTFSYSPTCITLTAARLWNVRDCTISFQNYGIYYTNNDYPDSGDNNLSGNVFLGLPTAEACIYTESSLGMFLTGNKIFGAKRGLWHVAKGSTGIYQIVANSFEEQVDCFIEVQQSTPGVSFCQMNVNANEFSMQVYSPNPQPTADLITIIEGGSGQYVQRINISDNTFNINVEAFVNVINIQDGDGVVISKNVINLTDQPNVGGIATGGNVTNAKVLDNVFCGALNSQKYSGGLNSATILRDLDGLAFADLDSWANGSQVYVTDGAPTGGGDYTLDDGGSGALAARARGVWFALTG